MRRNKYSKLPSKPVTKAAFSGPALKLNYKQPDGRYQKLDLTFFIQGDVPRHQVAAACAEVLGLEMQRYSRDTLVNFVFSLRVFNKFLRWREGSEAHKHITTTLQFSYELFVEFSVYLGSFNSEGTAASRYQAVARFLDLMRVLRPNYLRPEFKIPANRFSHRHGQRSTAGDILSLDDLLCIERVASREVSRIRENHRRACEMLKSAVVNDAQARMKPKPHGFWKSLANALYYIVRVEGITRTSDVTRQCLKIKPCPTATEMVGWYAPTLEEYFIPFLILLYLRTALNVTSMYRLKRDCLAEHPLPVGLTKLQFKKPRSKPLSNKELSFPTNQPNGTIDLIRFLLEYTQPWVEHAADAEKNSLFLYYSRIKGVRSPSNTFLINSLPKFIARNKLPHFTFDQLRPTVATLIYLQTRDIFRVQRLLGHASVRTTIKYIRGAAVHAENYRAMGKGIDKMTEAVTGIKDAGKGISVFTEPIAEVLARKIDEKELSVEAGERVLKGGCNTLVGRCKDPWNSPQPSEVKGRVCRSLHACIFCENCWIFVEDLVAVVEYRNSLEAEKSNMTSDMWELLHGAAVREINTSILSSFPADVISRVERQAKNARNITRLP